MNQNDNDHDDNDNDDSFEKESYLGNKLANTLEANDEVACVGSDDEGEDGQNNGNNNDNNKNKNNINNKQNNVEQKKTKKQHSKDNNNEDEYEDDFDSLIENGGEAYLDKASSKIDILEQSAINLESWLENLVRIFSSDFIFRANLNAFIIIWNFF